LEQSATLICPQGKRRYTRDPSRGYYYPDHLSLSHEVASALTAFETEFEASAPQEKYLYAGYSQGATMGALAFAPQGDRFSYLVLVEGGYADFSLNLARRFKKSGGRGALFICGTKRCRDQSREAVSRLKQLGLNAECHWAEGAGHRPDGSVTKALVSALPFVLSSDPRWNGVTPNLPEDVLNGNG
jgi:predicted esterase